MILNQYTFRFFCRWNMLYSELSLEILSFHRLSIFPGSSESLPCFKNVAQRLEYHLRLMEKFYFVGLYVCKLNDNDVYESFLLQYVIVCYFHDFGSLSLSLCYKVSSFFGNQCFDLSVQKRLRSS
jgi:hypothetical protein